MKRSILTDARGIPLSIVIDGANVHDCVLLEATLASIPIGRPMASLEHPQALCLDKGYDYPLVRELAAELNYTLHLRTRGEEKVEKSTDPSFRARRWVVERTHSWLNRFRRLLIRWEKKPENYLALLQFVAGLLARRIIRFYG